jgi:DNA-directed RNA polymerase subunit RPC12/RpoP
MAVELIKIQEEEIKPRMVCVHCKQEILIDIEPFKKDMTKVLRDRCPKCNGEMIVGMLLLAHGNLHKFLITLKAVIEAVGSAETQLLGGKRGKIIIQ